MKNKADMDNFLEDDLFDEPDKKRSLLILVSIIIACTALIAASWYIYHQYKERNDDEMLLITATQDEIKIAPIDPGGMVVDNMDKAVYDSIESHHQHETKAETLLLPSEEPVSKEHLAQTSVISQKETIAIKANEEAPVTNNITIVNENAAALPAPVVNEVKAEEYIKPKTVKSKAAPKFVKKDQVFYKVQLAAFKSKAEAEKQWGILQRKFAKAFENRQHYIVAKEIEGRGIFYRLQVGPYQDANEAKSACGKFKDSGLNCFIVKP